jgi:hypothetical protein
MWDSTTQEMVEPNTD